jgi:Trm5-related predicted tRNA methylase
MIGHSTEEKSIIRDRVATVTDAIRKLMVDQNITATALVRFAEMLAVEEDITHKESFRMYRS